MATPQAPLLALLAAALLVACGGGGYGGSPRYAGYDAQAGWQGSLSSAKTYSASGRGSDNKDYTVDLQFTPRGAATYPRTGMAASQVDQRASVQSGGVPLPGFEPLSSLFFVTGFVLVGLASGGGCSDVSNFVPLPTLADIGSSAPLFSSVGFPNCAPGGSSNGSGSSVNWSLEVYSGDVYFCTNTTQRNTAGAIAFTQSICLQINGNGTLGPKFEFRLAVPGQNFSLLARGG